jgi:hypothetical protein
VIIDRPYDSLDDFLEGDAWTVARGDMILLGVSGVDLGGAVEFSIVLSTGEAVVSGEGRVVEVVPPSEDFEGGTRVKFRKLDADSKAVLRRALEVQRRRAAEAAAEAEAEAAAAAGLPNADYVAAAEMLPSSAVQELPSSAATNEPPPPAAEAPPPPAAGNELQQPEAVAAPPLAENEPQQPEAAATPQPVANEAPPPTGEAASAVAPAPPPEEDPAPAPVASAAPAPLPPMSLDPFPATREESPVAYADAPFERAAPAPFAPRGQSSFRTGRPRQVDPPHNRNELLDRLRARRRGTAA